MSLKIWTELQTSMRENHPELADEFALCKDRESIQNFLDTKLPLPDKTNADGDRMKQSWGDRIASKISAEIKEDRKERGEVKKERPNEEVLETPKENVDGPDATIRG